MAAKVRGEYHALFVSHDGTLSAHLPGFQCPQDCLFGHELQILWPWRANWIEWGMTRRAVRTEKIRTVFVELRGQR